jgi:hypothetical protein
MKDMVNASVKFAPEEFESIGQRYTLHPFEMKDMRFRPQVGDTIIVKHRLLGRISGEISEADENEFSVNLNLDSGSVSVKLPFSKIDALDLT